MYPRAQQSVNVQCEELEKVANLGLLDLEEQKGAKVPTDKGSPLTD